MPKRCVRRFAAGRRLDDVGNLGKRALAVGVEGTGRAIVIALHNLVHAFGKRQVRHGITDVHQSTNLGVDRVALIVGGRPELAHTGAGRESERIRRLLRLFDVIEQCQPIDDVARFDLGD